MSNWQKDFDPKAYRLAPQGSAPKPGQDVRDGSVYVYEEPIKLAVRVALATGRPLLLLGPPGSGKSSLAAYAARSMDWNYFEQVVTSRTRAQDLQWTFDAVRRLRGAKELPGSVKAALPPGTLRGDDHPSVVLIDEVDKADPRCSQRLAGLARLAAIPRGRARARSDRSKPRAGVHHLE